MENGEKTRRAKKNQKFRKNDGRRFPGFEKLLKNGTRGEICSGKSMSSLLFPSCLICHDEFILDSFLRPLLDRRRSPLCAVPVPLAELLEEVPPALAPDLVRGAEGGRVDRVHLRCEEKESVLSRSKPPSRQILNSPARISDPGLFPPVQETVACRPLPASGSFPP